MILGLCKEPSHETRVSLLAEAVATLTKKGISVLVENGAGDDAFCSDAQYEKAGARIVGAPELYSTSDILLSINRPEILDKQHKASAVLDWCISSNVFPRYYETMGSCRVDDIFPWTCFPAQPGHNPWMY